MSERLGPATLYPIAGRTLRDQIAERLRQAIVAGALVPGTRLTEMELAAQLEVSRGPLREAIQQLVEQGLLVKRAYSGLSVATITARDVHELYSFRTELESFAFRLVWERRGPGFVHELHSRHERLVAAIDAGDATGAIEAELALHSLVYDWTGHRLLQETWGNLRQRLHFYFSVHQHAHGRRGPARDAHEVYVRLAAGEEPEAMQRHIAEHMRQGQAAVLAYVARED